MPTAARRCSAKQLARVWSTQKKNSPPTVGLRQAEHTDVLLIALLSGQYRCSKCKVAPLDWSRGRFATDLRCNLARKAVPSASSLAPTPASSPSSAFAPPCGRQLTAKEFPFVRDLPSE